MKINGLLISLGICLNFVSSVAIAVNRTPMEERVEEVQLALPEAFQTLGPKGVEAILQVIDFAASRSTDSVSIANGRLTLTSGTAVTTSDVTSAQTVYYTPYNGNKISLYNGTNWRLYDLSEISVAVPSNTSTPFDIFIYDNSGTLTLEAVAWSNTTTRATAITTQNGVYVKSGATSRRYLGTGCTTSVSGRTEDSVLRRLLWNQYNRVVRPLMLVENTASWTYNTASWRAVNGSNSNRVEVVVGVAGSRLKLTSHIMIHTTSGRNAQFGVGEDSTSSIHSNTLGRYSFYNLSGATDFYGQSASSFMVVPTVGYHYYQWLEESISGTTSTMYSVGSGAHVNSGMIGEIEG